MPAAPWAVAQQPKVPKFVNNFTASTNKVLGQMPGAATSPGAFGINASNQNDQMIAQQPKINAAPVAGLAAKPIASQTPDTINPAVAETPDPSIMDGTDAINQQGKSATEGLQAQVIAKQAADKAAADAAALEAAKQQSYNSGYNNGTVSYSGTGGLTGMAGMDKEQIDNANLIIKQGLARGLKGDDIQTALMTALAESGLRNLNHGDRDSVGLFQQRTSQGWGTVDQIMNPNYSTGKFYDTLGSTSRGPNLWNTAQNVQRSAFADGSNYQAQASQAANLWNAYNQNGGISTAPVTQANGAASWINANNGKYHDYDGVYGAQCVDLYAFYTSGFVGGKPLGVGYAQELWNTYDSNAYVRVGGNQRPQMGDVAIWSNGFNGMGGHVAIVAQDNGNGTIRALNANATSLGPNGNTVMSTLSKGSLLGYLRPRKLM